MKNETIDFSLSTEKLLPLLDDKIKEGMDTSVLLYLAVEADKIDAVKFLMRNGADPAELISEKTPVSLAVDQDKWEILEFFMTKDFNKTMLFEGIELLSPPMIDYLESKYVKVPYELKASNDIDWINQIF